jgi:RNA polymerase sigma-70 factor, ECF subfamily
MISLGADRASLGRDRKNDIRHIFRSKFILMVRLSHSMNNPLKQLDSNEADLISRVCKGEHKAFEELVHPYERLVYVTAISVLRNAADAEEVAQEAVLKAFSKLSSFRAECKFSTWLVQITYNEARMKLRKDRRHLYESVDDPRQDKEGDYWPKDFADWRPIPSELLENEQVRKALQNAINSLDDMYREVVNLRDIQNLSIKDTATVLGIPETSVKTRLRRARLLLRDALAPGIDGVWHTGHPY